MEIIFQLETQELKKKRLEIISQHKSNYALYIVMIAYTDQDSVFPF